MYHPILFQNLVCTVSQTNGILYLQYFHPETVYHNALHNISPSAVPYLAVTLLPPITLSFLELKQDASNAAELVPGTVSAHYQTDITSILGTSVPYKVYWVLIDSLVDSQFLYNVTKVLNPYPACGHIVSNHSLANGISIGGSV